MCLDFGLEINFEMRDWSRGFSSVSGIAFRGRVGAYGCWLEIR